MERGQYGMGGLRDEERGRSGTASYRTGEWRTGEWRMGEWRKGEWRTGEWRMGEWRTGEWRTGEWRTGEWRKGEWRMGEWRTGAGGAIQNGSEGGPLRTGEWRMGDYRKGDYRKGARRWANQPRKRCQQVRHSRQRCSVRRKESCLSRSNMSESCCVTSGSMMTAFSS